MVGRIQEIHGETRNDAVIADIFSRNHNLVLPNLPGMTNLLHCSVEIDQKQLAQERISKDEKCC